MAFLGVGPTEPRILLAAGAFALISSPVVKPFGLAEFRLFNLGGILGVAGMVMAFIITSAGNARLLYLEETHRS